MRDVEVRLILENIKHIMKLNKITYYELGQHLEMTEAGIKKMMNSKNISLSKILEITSFLKINIQDLIHTSKKPETFVVNLSKDQELFFESNPHYFQFFCMLAVEKLSIVEIQNRNQLNDRSVEKYLIKLDQLNLIDFTNKSKYKVKLPKDFQFNGSKSFMKKMKVDFSKKILKSAQNNKNSDDNLYHLSFMYLQKDSKKILLSKIKNTIAEYVAQSEVEQRLHNKELLESVSILSIITDSYVTNKIPNL